LLTVVQQTCYSGGNPDYARIKQLVDQYPGLFTFFPYAVQRIERGWADLSRPPQNQHEPSVRDRLGFLINSLDDRKDCIEAKMKIAGREIFRIRRKLQRYSSEYTPEELKTVEDIFRSSIKKRTAKLSSDDNFNSQRQLLNLYAEALIETGQV
jgi:hypothetical protein